MLRHLRRLLLSLAAVVTAWWLYALIAVPLIDPEVQRTPAETQSVEAAERESATLTETAFRAQLAAIFPPDAWELDNPKVFETDQGVFLFQEYHELPDNRFEIKPCTLVAFSKKVNPNGEATGDPGRIVALEAPQGAQLQFDETSDLSRFKFGKLLGGLLPGEIRIWSREPGGDADSLDLRTRNVQIEERRIWTPHEVAFRFGASHGKGRDLEIHLQRTVAAEDQESTSMVNSATGNIQSIELVHLDELHLEGLGEPGAASDSFAGAPLDIACRGPARINVVDLVATLEDQVSVKHATSLTNPDHLQCDLLTVVLRQVPAVAASPTVAAEGTESDKKSESSPKSKFEVERLIAAGEVVDFQMPSRNAWAKGQRLEVNVPAQRIRLEGAQGATLSHEFIELSAINLEYELPRRKGDVGRAWAQGPGRMTGQFGEGNRVNKFSASWGEELQLRPHEGFDVVSLTGGATIEYGGMGKFESNSLHLWLKPLPGAKRSDRPQLVPDRLLAQGDVTIRAAQLSSKTQRLEAWFRDGQGAEGLGWPGADSANRTPNGGGPGRLASTGSPSDSTASDPEAAKFEVNGDLVRVALLRGANEAIGLETVEVLGQVEIRELSRGTASEPPLKILGDRLKLEQGETGQGVLRVTGRPATVTARGMTLVGAEVRLDQATSEIRIPGPGEMTLPPFDLKPQPRAGVVYEGPRSMTPRGSQSTGRPTVISWKNGLNFDGQTAQFHREIQVRVAQRLSTGEWLEFLILGEELEVRLAAPVSLGGSPLGPPVVGGERPGAAPTELDYLKFVGHVYLDGRTSQDDVLTSTERMQLRNLTLRQATGLLSGEGPGWLAGTRIDPNSIMPPAPPTNLIPNAAPPPAPPAGPPKLVFLHVGFQRGIEGRLLERQVELVERVRGVFGPVPDWETELDPIRPETWPADAMELTCDRLSVAQQGGATPGSASTEMNALGNATVEGQRFRARAARISYSQLKDMLILAGDGRTNAEFWRKPITQAKPDVAAANFTYSRRENGGAIRVNGVRYIDLNSLGP